MPPAAAAAVPLSLVPILAVVDVAGSAIVPAVTPLLVHRSRDYQERSGGGDETMDLSTKGRRCRPKDFDDDADKDEAVPLIKVPRRRTSADDEHQSAPLNLSIPRDTPRDSTASSPYRIICEWDATENSSSSATDAAEVAPATSEAADSQAAASQILLLSGKQYEIVPLGDGRWISRNEYELQRGLQKSSSGVEQTGTGRTTSDGKTENSSGSDQLPSLSASSSSSSAAAAAGEVGKDEELAKVIGPDEVSSTILTENEATGASKDDDEEEEEEGVLQIAEDATSDHDDDDDTMTSDKEQGQCDDLQPAKHSHDSHVETTTSTTTAAVTVDADEKLY